MRKVVGFIVIFILFILLNFSFIYLLKHINPYELNFDNINIDYNDVEYENLYQITYGSITQYINEETVTDSSEYIIDNKLISNSNAKKYFVGQYLQDDKIKKGANIRIISMEEKNDKIDIEYVVSKNILINFQIDSKYINYINEKNEMHVTINDEEIPASIVQIGPNIQDNDKFILKVLLDDTQVISRPGSKVNLNLAIAKKENVLCVPKDCLYMDGLGQPFVMVKEGESVEIRKVEIGIQDDEDVEIIEGLLDGDILVEKD